MVKLDVVVSVVLLLHTTPASDAITISQTNPRYFNFRGRTTALITSAEHYGGLVNKDFDYVRYLDTLQQNNFTLTQAFVGSYVEPDNDVNPNGDNPQGNPLSPANGSFMSPWARVAGHPGGPLGGNKFDLFQYDQAYFDRLESFVLAAAVRGIVVELVMFCGYDTMHQFIFDENPMNPNNTVNTNISGVNRSNVYTFDSGNAMLVAQMRMAWLVVSAVQRFDNVMANIVFISTGTDQTWANQVAETIHTANSNIPIVVPRQWVPSLVNKITSLIVDCGPVSDCSGSDARSFSPPDMGRPAMLDSKGVVGGVSDYQYAYWTWFMNGGASIYNLDWSYTVGHEDGSKHDVQVTRTPSGPQYRSMVSILSRFMSTLNLDSLVPDNSWIRITGSLNTSDRTVSALGPRPQTVGGQYAAYLPQNTSHITLLLEALPNGYGAVVHDATLGNVSFLGSIHVPEGAPKWTPYVLPSYCALNGCGLRLVAQA